MNAQNKTDTIVIPEIHGYPIVDCYEYQQVSHDNRGWPAMIGGTDGSSMRGTACEYPEELHERRSARAVSSRSALWAKIFA